MLIVYPGTNASVDALVFFGSIMNPQVRFIFTRKKIEVLQPGSRGQDHLKRKINSRMKSYGKNLETGQKNDLEGCGEYEYILT